MAGYDGTVRIDSTIDAKGFNAGMRNLRSSAAIGMNGILISFLKVGYAIRTIVLGLALVGGAIVGAAVAFVHFSRQMIEGLKKGIDTTSVYYQQILLLETQFNRVTGAIYSLFATLLQAALPAIIRIVDWLVRMLDIINQVVAALLGQTTVMKVVAGSTAATAASTGKAAKNTEKMKKEARGALAAFDKLDVLAKKTSDDMDPDAAGGAGGAGAGGLSFEQVPIDAKWLAFAEQIKQAFRDAIQTIKDAWLAFVKVWDEFWSSPFGQLVQSLWQNFLDTWSKIFENTRNVLGYIKEHIERIIKGISQFITGILVGDWRMAWEGIKNITLGVMGVVLEVIRGTFANISIFLEGWRTAFGIILAYWSAIWRSIWAGMQAIAVGVIRTLQGAWVSFTNWFVSVVPRAIYNAFATAFSGVVNVVRWAINNILSFINNMISGIAYGLNVLASIGGAVGVGIPKVSAPRIPYLASGAVIPPNAEFMAVLGDQRSGRNIEAPEGLIRSIIREEMGSIKGDFTFKFDGSMGELVRVLKPRLDSETVRIGRNLAKGAA